MARSMVLVFAALGVVAARAEPVSTARLLFEQAWQRAECNQVLDESLNSAAYRELGGGYSVGMVLCWLGRTSETQIVFLVAPKTGGRPQVLRFEEWRGKIFQPTDALTMPAYNAETRTITSYHRYARGDTCGAAGEWTWTGAEFKMTGYWYKPDCNDGAEFDRSDRFRVFPPKE